MPQEKFIQIKLAIPNLLPDPDERGTSPEPSPLAQCPSIRVADAYRAASGSSHRNRREHWRCPFGIGCAALFAWFRMGLSWYAATLREEMARCRRL